MSLTEGKLKKENFLLTTWFNCTTRFDPNGCKIVMAYSLYFQDFKLFIKKTVKIQSHVNLRLIIHMCMYIYTGMFTIGF